MKTKVAKSKKADIKYGNVAVDLKNIAPEEIKVRITTFMDSDILQVLKAQAKELGVGYQTFLNTFLRETLLKEPGVITRLKRIEKALEKGA